MQTVLVTGAGSGMGLECALFLAAKGCVVYGTVLDEAQQGGLEREAAKRSVEVRALRMDVTRPDEIAAAFDTLIRQSGRIDALVQFAGMGLRGFFEDLSLEEIRQVYEVNVFGAMSVTRAALPHMRAAGGGRIVITSSVAGRIGSMSLSGYASSKFALEGFAECLAQEVAPLGIFVSLLEPGLIATPHFTVHRNRAKKAVDPESYYYPWFCRHEQIVDGLLEKNRLSTKDVARAVYRILTARRPKLRYLVGAKARIVVALRRRIPGEAFERFYFWLIRRLVTKPRGPVAGLSGEGDSRQRRKGAEGEQ